MNFSISIFLAFPYPGISFLRSGVGSKIFGLLRPLCVDLDLGPKQFFFLYMDPLARGRARQPPVGPTYGPLLAKS